MFEMTILYLPPAGLICHGNLHAYGPGDLHLREVGDAPISRRRGDLLRRAATGRRLLSFHCGERLGAEARILITSGAALYDASILTSRFYRRAGEAILMLPLLLAAALMMIDWRGEAMARPSHWR